MSIKQIWWESTQVPLPPTVGTFAGLGYHGGHTGNSPGLSFQRTCTFSSASKLFWEDQENKVPKRLPQVTLVLLGTDPRACQVPDLNGQLWRKLPSIGQSFLTPLDPGAAQSTRIAIWLPQKRPLLPSLGPKDPPCSAELTP